MIETRDRMTGLPKIAAYAERTRQEGALDAAIAAVEKLSPREPKPPVVDATEAELHEQLRILAPIHEHAKRAFGLASIAAHHAALAESEARIALREITYRIEMIKQDLGINDDDDDNGGAA